MCAHVYISVLYTCVCVHVYMCVIVQGAGSGDPGRSYVNQHAKEVRVQAIQLHGEEHPGRRCEAQRAEGTAYLEERERERPRHPSSTLCPRRSWGPRQPLPSLSPIPAPCPQGGAPTPQGPWGTFTLQLPSSAQGYFLKTCK